ncbi:MAG: hypothetical protein ACRERD_15630 [Candidatus Binatia bacterium]
MSSAYDRVASSLSPEPLAALAIATGRLQGWAAEEHATTSAAADAAWIVYLHHPTTRELWGFTARPKLIPVRIFPRDGGGSTVRVADAKGSLPPALLAPLRANVQAYLAGTLLAE